MTRSSTELVPIAALTLSLALAGSSASAEEGPSFEGVFRYSGGEKQLATRRARIESSVAALSLFLRPVARHALDDLSKVPGRIVVVGARGGKVLSIALSPRPPRTSKVDGTLAAFTTIRGSKATLRRTQRGRQLVEVMAQPGGQRRITYVLSSDGRWLTTRWSFDAPRLPAPLQYQLSYRRQSP